MISAKIIADSKNEFGGRITTFVLTMPRIILAEFNTHRVISRNSASSRAIPFEKMLKMVQETPFIPIKWMKDHTGMQGNEYFEKEEEKNALKKQWLQARDSAVSIAKDLAAELMYFDKDNYFHESGSGLTKQMCNRLLEPWMYHTVIATATDWGNFFALRAHKDAEIHMQDLAYKMLDEYNRSEPKLLKLGEWHVPFGDKLDVEKISKIIDDKKMEPFHPLNNADDISIRAKEHGLIFDEIALKIATARCARVSYTTVGEEGKPDNYENDIKLHDRLLASGHMSPMEHCAQAQNVISGNFHGFRQYRKTLKGENKTDNRIIKK